MSLNRFLLEVDLIYMKKKILLPRQNFRVYDKVYDVVQKCFWLLRAIRGTNDDDLLNARINYVDGSERLSLLKHTLLQLLQILFEQKQISFHTPRNDKWNPLCEVFVALRCRMPKIKRGKFNGAKFICEYEIVFIQRSMGGWISSTILFLVRTQPSVTLSRFFVAGRRWGCRVIVFMQIRLSFSLHFECLNFIFRLPVFFAYVWP